MRRLTRAFALILALAAAPASAEDGTLAPATEAEYATLARLTAGALLAWADGDTEAILAAEDAGLAAWLDRERSLALTLPADRLLPPFAGEPFPCVPLWTTLRILALRQIPPKVLNDMSVAVLLERALTLSAAQERFTLSAPVYFPDLRARLERDPAGIFRALQYGFLVGPERAWLIGVAPGALSAATRDAGVRWHVDWRLPLAVDEWYARGALLPVEIDPDVPEPAAWPAADYLKLFSEEIAGFPQPEELLRLAEPPRPDPTRGCWEPFLDPTLMLCAQREGWGPCQRCDVAPCAKGEPQ